MRFVPATFALLSLAFAAARTADAAPPPIATHRAATTGSLPKGVTIAPDGSRLYVTNYGAKNHHNVSIYDASPGAGQALREIGHLDVPGIVVESAIAPDGRTLYLSNFKRNVVQFVDLASGRVRREVKAGAHPKILTLSRDGKRLFAANWSSQNVTEIDTTTGRRVRTLRAHENPRGMAITRSGRLYVANFGAGSIDVYEGAEMEVHKTLRNVCKIPRHLVLSPDDSKLYITCMGDNALAVMETRGDTVIQRVPVGHFPKAADVTRDGRFVMTADYRGSTVTCVDTKDWTTRTLDVPGMDAASGIVAARRTFEFFVTGWYDDHLYDVGPAGVGPAYEVDAKTAKLTAMRRLWHRKHPVE